MDFECDAIGELLVSSQLRLKIFWVFPQDAVLQPKPEPMVKAAPMMDSWKKKKKNQPNALAVFRNTSYN